MASFPSMSAFKKEHQKSYKFVQKLDSLFHQEILTDNKLITDKDIANILKQLNIPYKR